MDCVELRLTEATLLYLPLFFFGLPVCPLYAGDLAFQREVLKIRVFAAYYRIVAEWLHNWIREE